MKLELSGDEIRRAKHPHELFLTNMIGNHILWFVAALGMFGSFWQPLALVPVFSVAILGYILWRARRARQESSWYVMCQWQIAARRSRGFILMLGVLVTVSCLGLLGHFYLGMEKVAVMAMVGGMGLLPVLVSVLALIVMESDALHQVSQGKLSPRVFERYPNPEAVILEDDRQSVSEQPAQRIKSETDH
ncbi:hypothetical protein [Motiliproteus sp. SC1-56]|uniref:hypothetical protein n=1 Tax=Motiliproteus sp. SC1-56 TaxID=2799565 RepID=UPI001A8EC0B1|nr:hypothetical protein [Motiliproteus sp. SC1-56]